MLRGIYSAASGMIHTQAKQDAAANNIANSGTAGYKQDKVVAEPFPEVMLQNKDKTVFGVPRTQKLGTMTFGVKEGEVYTDFSQGIIQQTGSDLDFAIEGRGFFAVQHFDGINDSVRYTRDGGFKLDGEGRIVTSDGDYVMGMDMETGSIGPMEVGGGKVTVDNQGVVSVDSVEKHRIQLYDFEDYNGLAKIGGNMYQVTDDSVRAEELEPGQYGIKQGQIEQSNVDMASEMVSMITNLRSYQANQRVIQSIDETLAKAVNEVGSIK